MAATGIGTTTCCAAPVHRREEVREGAAFDPKPRQRSSRTAGTLLGPGGKLSPRIGAIGGIGAKTGGQPKSNYVGPPGSHEEKQLERWQLHLHIFACTVRARLVEHCEDLERNIYTEMERRAVALKDNVQAQTDAPIAKMEDKLHAKLFMALEAPLPPPPGSPPPLELACCSWKHQGWETRRWKTPGGSR